MSRSLEISRTKNNFLRHPARSNHAKFTEELGKLGNWKLGDKYLHVALYTS